MFLAILGYLSAALFLVGDTHYILDTIKGTTRPHRISFAIFLVVNVIDVVNQLAVGATNSLWIFFAATLTTAIILALSFWKGAGGAEPLDWVVFAGAVVGLVLWGILRTPMASIICNLVVMTITMIPIAKKSYLDPASESKLAWLLCGLSSVLSALSVGQWDLKLLLLPIHGIIIQLGIWAILVLRERSTPSGSQSSSSDPYTNLV
jgi:hypothetical protein